MPIFNFKKDGSRLKDLGRSIYARDPSNIPFFKRHRLKKHELSTQQDWQDDGVREAMNAGSRKKAGLSLAMWTLLGSSVFFMVAALVAGFLFFGGVNRVSPEKIAVIAVGPITADIGDTVPFHIKVTNNNPTMLQNTELLIEYPEGTRNPANLDDELMRESISLGNLSPGASAQHIAHAALFGSEGVLQEIIITLEYRVPGSSATFFKKTLYGVTIGAAPVRVAIDLTKEVIGGQEFAVIVDIDSNTPTTLSGLLMKIEYPEGFDFIHASPEPVFGNDLWDLGDLERNGKRKITIRGKISAEDDDQRVFRTRVGLASAEDKHAIGTTLVSLTDSLIVKRPFIGIDMAINGDSAREIAVTPQDTNRVDISWVNNLSTRIVDVIIEATINGALIDERTISVSSGFYRSESNTALWNQQTSPTLAAIDAGKVGKVSFSFASLAPVNSGRVVTEEPEVTITVSVKGRRLSETGVSEAIDSSAIRLVRLITDVELGARATHFGGPFSNTGPMPPKAEQETTYTITWSLTNSTNRVSGATVRATLPTYMRWMDAVSPLDEKIVFQPIGGVITWEVGEIAPRAGFEAPPREVSFQLAFKPSVNQIGNRPDLLNDSVLAGRDVFSDTSITDSVRALDTRLVSDPGFDRGMDEVVP